MRLGMDVYVAAMEMDAGSLPEYDRERLLANDKDAYAAQQIANLEWGAPDEDIVNMTLPTFVYAGTKDKRNHEPAKRCASLAPNASFLSLPDHTHMQAFLAADTMVPHVREFITGVTGYASSPHLLPPWAQQALYSAPDRFTAPGTRCTEVLEGEMP